MASIGEMETIERIKAQIFCLDKQINQKKLTMDESMDLIPGFIHLNSYTDISIVNANNTMANHFELTVKDIQDLGLNFQATYVHPGSTEIVIPHLQSFLQRNDFSEVFSFFQGFRRDAQSSYEWYFSTSKIRKSDGLILSITNPISSFGHLSKKIARVIEEDIFVQKHFQQFSQLTKREKEILKLIALGYTSHDISDRLYISKLTVKTHRQNIMKKLDITRLVDIIQYAQAFDLI